MKPDARILICGAGIAGLAAAITLGRAGMRPVVLEKAPALRADGFIISLSHHAFRFAEDLGLMPALRAIDTGIRRSSYHCAEGRALLELDYTRMFQGLDVIQVMRDDLERVLYDAARDLAEFRFGTSIAAIAQQADAVQVTDTRGRAEGYDVVIGADGLHSVVRALAFADAPARTHALGLWSAAFRLPNVLGLHAKFETHMERDRYMVVFTTGDADLAAVFVWAEDGLEVPPQTERRAWLEARYRGAPEVVRAVLGQAPRDGGIYLDPLFQIELPHWSRGRVVLLGDAAHCITLLSGQGASAAFSGASRLARALIEHADPTAAFHQYEAALQPLIATLQPRTRAAAHWYVPRSAWRHWLRDAGLRLLPAAYFEHHFRRKYRAA